MEDLPNEPTSELAGLAGKWTGYSALGSFLLYLFGYLVLRFQLYTYGVATNLDAFDEKYLFAGCRFFLFLGMALPSILLILCVLLVPLFAAYRFMPSSFRFRLHSHTAHWLRRPYLPRITACLLAVFLIQFVLRQCVLLSNILLQGHPPDFWIGSLLLAGDLAQSMFFTALVLGIGPSLAVLVYTLRVPPARDVLSTLLTWLLSFLVVIELLLLPVNYGILVNSNSLPRVSQIENQSKLPTGTAAWLVWESKEALTYLVCENNNRTLLSVPRKESRVSITGYDPIFLAVGQPPCLLSN